MKYLMKVVIADPETPEGMSSDLLLKIDVTFVYDSEQYGNGYYVALKNKMLPFGKYVIDLRYDCSFDPINKIKWLTDWAHNYWTGKNGAYYIKQLEITHL